jgi:predicted anti-sigma-YlaC factor YlaD
MNCRQLHSVLDAERAASLAEREAVDEHLAACAECRETFAAFGALVAEPVPKPPPDLQRRVAAAIDDCASSDALRLRRSLVLGSVLVVGAAVAKTLSLGIERGQRAYTQS